LRTLPPLSADLGIPDPKPSGNLRACAGMYRDSLKPLTTDKILGTDDSIKVNVCDFFEMKIQEV